MSAPLESPEFRDNDPDTPDRLYVGDYKDDDPQVIDSFFIETDRPADPQVEAIQASPLKASIKPTQLLNNTIVLTVGMNPVQLLPADPKRKSLTMLMTTPTGSAGANDYVNIADNVGAVSLAQQNGMPTGVTRMRAWATDHTLVGHTGPVWISGSNGQVLPLEVTVAVVTE